MKPKLKDVMTADPETVHLGQPISDAYTMLQGSSFEHVPVMDGKTVVGLISNTDILKLVYDVDAADERMLRTFLDHQFTLEDAMSTDLVTVTKDDGLEAVIEHMTSNNVHSVLVTDDKGELEGIVTSTDALRLLSSLL